MSDVDAVKILIKQNSTGIFFGLSCSHIWVVQKVW